MSKTTQCMYKMAQTHDQNGPHLVSLFLGFSLYIVEGAQSENS